MIPFKRLLSESVFSKMYLKCQHGNKLLSIMDNLTAFFYVYYTIIELLMTYDQVSSIVMLELLELEPITNFPWRFLISFFKKSLDCFILLCLKIIYIFSLFRFVCFLLVFSFVRI